MGLLVQAARHCRGDCRLDSLVRRWGTGNQVSVHADVAPFSRRPGLDGLGHGRTGPGRISHRDVERGPAAGHAGGRYPGHGGDHRCTPAADVGAVHGLHLARPALERWPKRPALVGAGRAGHGAGTAEQVHHGRPGRHLGLAVFLALASARPGPGAGRHSRAGGVCAQPVVERQPRLAHIGSYRRNHRGCANPGRGQAGLGARVPSRTGAAHWTDRAAYRVVGAPIEDPRHRGTLDAGEHAAWPGRFCTAVQRAAVAGCTGTVLQRPDQHELDGAGLAGPMSVAGPVHGAAARPTGLVGQYRAGAATASRCVLDGVTARHPESGPGIEPALRSVGAHAGLGARAARTEKTASSPALPSDCSHPTRSGGARPLRLARSRATGPGLAHDWATAPPL